MKLVFCIPTITKPYQVCLDSLEATVPLLDAAEIDHYMVNEIGCPYISAARSTMLRKALDVKADTIVFIDHDLSWRPEDMMKLVQTKGDFVMGTYRFKKDEEEYMGRLLSGDDGRPLVRNDGAIATYCGPAGFLKITATAINILMEKYPELCYGDRHAPHFDFFNHGAHKYTWWGEDYAACRRWVDIGQQIWTVPDLNVDHWSGEKCYKGNLHQFLLRQPGGSESANPDSRNGNHIAELL